MQPAVIVGLDGSPAGLAAARRPAGDARKRELGARLLYAWPLPAPEPTGGRCPAVAIPHD
ncbi:hypothetical protein [Streptomyces sp. NPDC006274]|uniref:hypothetical protein n=1 Tax=unclassified Streptomyces TaxID=2593676 RepID=UPI0033A2F107